MDSLATLVERLSGDILPVSVKNLSVRQAESSQARVCWQISWPADAWNHKKGYSLSSRRGTECSVNLGGKNREE